MRMCPDHSPETGSRSLGAGGSAFFCDDLALIPPDPRSSVHLDATSATGRGGARHPSPLRLQEGLGHFPPAHPDVGEQVVIEGRRARNKAAHEVEYSRESTVLMDSSLEQRALHLFTVPAMKTRTQAASSAARSDDR